MKNISKKFDITLSTEDTSILKTGNKYYVGDDVEYTIQIILDHDYKTNLDIPMNLSECVIEAKGLRMTSKTTMTQEFGEFEGGIISIIDEEKGLIKFKPKDTFVECADKLLVQFLITDSDESIAIQPFLSIVLDNIESENIVIPSNDIKTLKDLAKLIEEAKTSLLSIESEMESVSQEIGEGLSNMSKSIELESDSLQLRIDTLSKQIDNIQENINGINNSILKQSSLIPFVRAGENTVSFKFSVLGIEAKSLIGSTMLVNISHLDISEKQGVCYSGQIGAICYKDSNNVSNTYLSLTPVYTPNVPGTQINPSTVFNGAVNKLQSDTRYYEIWIKTSIPKDCIGSAKCHLMSFGSKMGDDI